MGNCQAVDAAALVIQHPNGKQDRMYWPITASEIMKTNPGHYVTLIIPLPAMPSPPPAPGGGNGNNNNNGSHENANDKKTAVRFTRVKLLRPSDTLVLGHAYRLVTTQAVMEVVRAKKHAKMRKSQSDQTCDNLEINSDKVITSSCDYESGKSVMEKKNQAINRHQQRSGSTNSSSGRHKSWQPSLHSITESPKPT